MDVIGADGISVYEFSAAAKYADEWRDLSCDAVKMPVPGCKTDPAPLTTVDVRSLLKGAARASTHSRASLFRSAHLTAYPRSR